MLGLLRKAGQKIRAFDDAYASRLAELIQGKDPGTARAVLSIIPSVPVSTMGKLAAVGADDPMKLKAIAALTNYGAPVASAGVRYGLPALGAKVISDGVTELYDIAEAIPLGPQQSLDTLEM